MKKSFGALLIAFLMTCMVAVSIFAIGGAALHNRTGVPVSDSLAQGAGSASLNSPAQSDQLSQLQSLVSQYQDREKQYQQREQQLQSQLSQAQAQVQQDQQMLQQVQLLLRALQQRGVIRVTDDGRVFINQ
jgi:hypothetical protein